MWIYYYVMYGPGHQGHEDDFISFPDGTDEESIEESIFDRYSRHNSVIFSFWEVKILPDNFVNKEIKEAEASIEYFQKTIKILKKSQSFNSEQPKEVDKTIKKNLRKIIKKDVIKRLHKAGFMYMSKDISDWYYGVSQPPKEHRAKILGILRRSKKYPN